MYKLKNEFYKDKGISGGYKFNNDAEKIYENFFNGAELFNQIYDFEHD